VHNTGYRQSVDRRGASMGIGFAPSARVGYILDTFIEINLRCKAQF
jgi:hypothetical protein